MDANNWSRRDLFRASAAIAGAAFLAEGCSSSLKPKVKSSNSGGGAVSEPTGSGAAPAGKEAPTLASLVSQGKLPSVDKRLPTKPCVLKPFDGAGDYGGTIRRSCTGPTDSTTPANSASWAEWDPVNVVPVATMTEGWDISDSGRTYTFHLRAGLKWSDGQPYTTDDVVFMMTNVLQNTTLNPVYPIYWTINGKPPTVKKVDDTTFSFTYDDPAALLPEFLCYVGRTLIAPMHYLKQFHPDFMPAAQLNAAAKKAGFQNVQQYYTAMNSFWTNKDLPVMNPWVMTQPMPASGGHAVSTRNPYYYKVDSAGRQLPYIDKITYDVLDAASAALHASNGQIDLQSNNISFKNVPVLAENAASKGYVVNHWQSDAPWISMYVNQYSPDAVLRPLLQNSNFRQALSLAINRDEMNQSLYAGQGGTQQPCGVPQDPYFVKGSGQTWTKYDPATANSLLDGLGLKMGPGGVRLRPDGKPLELIIETFEFETGVDASDGYEFVTRYWGKVGVKATMKTEDSSLWVQRVEANNVNIAGYTVAGFLWDVDPEWYVPVATNSYWAPMFGLYYSTNGKQGVRPTAIVAKLQDLYNQLRAEVDRDKRIALGQQILSIHNDNVFIIGTVTEPWEPMISNADMINVRSTSIESYRMGHEQATKVEQVAYKSPDKHNYP